jgi:hypothetical protein
MNLLSALFGKYLELALVGLRAQDQALHSFLSNQRIILPGGSDLLPAEDSDSFSNLDTALANLNEQTRWSLELTKKWLSNAKASPSASLENRVFGQMRTLARRLDERTKLPPIEAAGAELAARIRRL